MTFRAELIELDACSAATEWVGDRDAATAWAECERSDWMHWSLEKTNVQHDLLILIACDHAESVIEYAGEHRAVCRAAIDAARNVVTCDHSPESVQKAKQAAEAAEAAWYAQAAWAARDAAGTAWAASWPARVAAWSARVAAWAAEAAARAALAAGTAAEAAWAAASQQQADTIRRHIPAADFAALWAKRTIK